MKEFGMQTAVCVSMDLHPAILVWSLLTTIDVHNVQENATTPQLQTCSSSAADSIT